MHNIYYLGLSGERSLPFGLLVYLELTNQTPFVNLNPLSRKPGFAPGLSYTDWKILEYNWYKGRQLNSQKIKFLCQTFLMVKISFYFRHVFYFA